MKIKSVFHTISRAPAYSRRAFGKGLEPFCPYYFIAEVFPLIEKYWVLFTTPSLLVCAGPTTFTSMQWSNAVVNQARYCF